MSEECRVYYDKYMDAFKKQNVGSIGKEDVIKRVFNDAFKLGREVGFDSGYTKGVRVRDSFDLDDAMDENLLEESESNFVGDDSSFDTADELLNY